MATNIRFSFEANGSKCLDSGLSLNKSVFLNFKGFSLKFQNKKKPKNKG